MVTLFTIKEVRTMLTNEAIADAMAATLGLVDEVYPVERADVLRAQIDKPFDSKMIQTRHGIGYRLVESDAVPT